VVRGCIGCVLVLVLPSLALADDYDRGLEALSKKDYDLAIACFKAWIRANPEDAGAYINRGIAYAGKKDYDRAVFDYNEAIRIDPKKVSAYYNRGNAYRSRKQSDRAIKDYSEVIRLDPKHVAAYNARGSAHDDKKEYDEAIADYTEAIRLDPKYALAYLNRGNAYRNKKDYDKAVADLLEAIQIDPKNASAFDQLAWLLATSPKDSARDGKKAVGLANKACELSDWKNASYLDTLAAAHAECGDFKEAVKWENKALELWSDDREKAETGRRRLKLYEEGKPYREE
jgi:tetratricopeptide (TPR) repeat protein